MKKYLSIDDSNVFKGLAIMLMLWHHIFFQKQAYFDEFLFLSYDVIEYTRVMAKLCVSIFVFVSGYGLAVQAEKHGGIGNLKEYYIHRFSRLYFNYWFIFLIFVPITVLYFHRTLAMAYGANIIQSLFLDFTGLIYCFGGTSYNPTWWFYSCIIILYLLFPFLYKLSRKSVEYTLLLCVCIKYLPFNSLPFDFLNPIENYIYVFIAGILFVNHDLYAKRFLSHSKEVFLWTILLVVMLIERNSVGQLADCVITCCLVKLYGLLDVNDWFKKIMGFLGKHSMNIFLIHTFIFEFWFSPQLYSLRNPILIFIVLLLVCLVISIAIEKTKDIIRFNQLVNRI